jgi:EAL domain-containing protein (putative c-di-GMP-specific phosphodiesterase class I)
MVNQPSDVAIVKAIIVMAKGLGLDLIAEGVETDEHLAYLSNFGCNNYQGYFFSKPLPADQLSSYVKSLND